MLTAFAIAALRRVRRFARSIDSLVLVGLLVIVAFVAVGRSQGLFRGRVLISTIAPPPIEQGISPDRSHAPNTREALRRRRVRAVGAVADRAGAAGTRYRAGRVIVKFRDTVSPAARATAMTALAAVTGRATVAPRLANQNFDVIEIDPSIDAEAVARAFRARADVEYAQAAYRLYPDFVPNDTFYSDQWNLHAINMEQAWDIQPQAGSQVTVAVLDTGVAFTTATLQYTAAAFSIDSDGFVAPPVSGGMNNYPALGTMTLQFVPATELQPLTRFVAPRDFIWNDTLPVDLAGHGTHISGTIGQLTNNAANGLGDVAHSGGTAGVAFNVKLMPVKVLSTEWDDIFGSPNIGDDDVVATGIRYAADNGAKVINLSLGRTGPANCGVNPNQDGCAPVLEDAVKYAVTHGAFVSISAGNSFEDGNPTEILAEIASRVPGAVSVAGVNRNLGHASYSSAGSYIELAAPGGDFEGFDATGGILQQTLDLALVETFDNRPSEFGPPRFDALAYYYVAGTSSAAPHVAGVAAMLMQQGITNPVAIEAALERFAVDIGTPGRDFFFGFGFVDARATLRGLGLAK
jgi:serine protease